MIQAIQKKLNNRKGFTLIELIVVIVILGILAAILVPTFSGYADRAKKSADEAAIANVKTALAIHYAENGEDLTFIVSDVGAVTGTDAATGIIIVNSVYPKSGTEVTGFKMKNYSSVTFTAGSSGITSSPT